MTFAAFLARPRADFGGAELELEDAEWMLNLGPHTGLAALPSLVLTAVACIPDGRSHIRTDIAAIAQHTVFPAMQQRVGDRDIADVGNGACRVVHQSGEFIDTDVRLHSDVPLRCSAYKG